MSNQSLILMHLDSYLRETGQYGNVNWSCVMAFCIGYYGQITMDHVNAITELERTGALIPSVRATGH